MDSRPPGSSESKFLLLDPGHDAGDRDDGRDDNGPELDMQRTDVEASLSGQGDRDEAQYEDGVTTGAVVFVNGLGVVHAAEQLRDVVLRDADEGL